MILFFLLAPGLERFINHVGIRYYESDLQQFQTEKRLTIHEKRKKAIQVTFYTPKWLNNVMVRIVYLSFSDEFVPIL